MTGGTYKYKAIGVIHSPFGEPKGTPLQAAAAEGVEGSVEVFPEYADGLRDIEGFSHVILLYHFHLAKPGSLSVKPFLDNVRRGVFATRAPSRPNRIGLSVARLQRVDGNAIYVQDVDIVEGTPLLDIKPYVPQLDPRGQVRIGWMGRRMGELPVKRDDGRFASKPSPSVGLE